VPSHQDGIASGVGWPAWVWSTTVSTFITRLDAAGPGVRLAVKDLIDTVGVPTTAGCRAVATGARPALADAACLAGARAAGARIVGKTNLHELALGVTGVNPWFGTPVNPLDPRRVPGGSSSGSAVAVAGGEADVAYGSDTGGSVRIPSACCGTAGLKTTWGRVSLDGVWPLAPSLDTVGPMARDVTGLITGMALLEPGFALSDTGAGTARRVARLRVEADPDVDAAIDRALAATEWDVIEVVFPEWDDVTAHTATLLVAEAWESDRDILERDPAGVGADVAERLRLGDHVDAPARRSAGEVRERWRDRLRDLFRQVDVLAMPTLTVFPPVIDEGESLLLARCTLPFNLAGVPALSLPVPAPGGFPASIQLVGPERGEEDLLAAGLVVEAAVRS